MGKIKIKSQRGTEKNRVSSNMKHLLRGRGEGKIISEKEDVVDQNSACGVSGNTQTNVSDNLTSTHLTPPKLESSSKEEIKFRIQAFDFSMAAVRVNVILQNNL